MMEFLIDANIEKAKQGDTVAARKVLREFCACVKNNTDSKGEPFRRSSGIGSGVVTNTIIDERIIRYLAECFEKIIDDAPGVRMDANHALNIVEAGKKGNKKTAARRQEVLGIGLEVMDRHKEIKANRKQTKPQGSYSPLDEAINDIAGNHNKSYQTIKDAYDEWNKLLNQVVEEAKKSRKP